MLKFDNSTPWWGKTVRYCVKIVSKNDSTLVDDDMDDSGMWNRILRERAKYGGAITSMLHTGKQTHMSTIYALIIAEPNSLFENQLKKHVFFIYIAYFFTRNIFIIFSGEKPLMHFNYEYIYTLLL